VEVLSGRELLRVALVIADAAVVEATVAGHIVERARAAHVPGALADDHGELAFVVEALGDARPLERAAMAHYAVAEAHEHHGMLGALAPHLLHVRNVIDADAEQLRGGVGNRGQKRNVGERVVGLLALELAQLRQGARDQHVAQAAILGAQALAGVDHSASAHDPVARAPVDLEARQPHRSLSAKNRDMLLFRRERTARERVRTQTPKK
jgi:hypothetical protein